MRSPVPALALAVAAATSTACGVEFPLKARLLPRVQIESQWRDEVTTFLKLAAHHGKPVPQDRLDRLRVVKSVDNLPELEAALGIRTDDSETMTGACAEIEEKEKVGDGQGVSWTMHVRFWREVWLDTRELKPAQARKLLWHELGHCLFGLEHTEVGGEHAIMASTLDEDAEVVEESWDALTANFFESVR